MAGELVDVVLRLGSRLILWCPGCEDTHPLPVGGGENWDWNGSLAVPTIHPSIKVTGVQWEPTSGFHRRRHRVAPGGATTCHSFVTAGWWEYCGDSTHDLASQRVRVQLQPA